MSNYYEKKDAKVNIAHELINRGWKVYGYKADESDSMTDYYSPAHWDGIATKNGYILVVDNSQGAEAQEIKKYNYNKVSYADREKISKLEEMTQERGCTAGEEENAKRMIEKIKNKESEGVAEYEVIGVIPAHMGNPGKSKWHIEKDGKIFDKGTALTKYADLPKTWVFDYEKMEYADSYKRVKEWNYDSNDWEWIERKPSEELIKAVEAFKNLILRFENIASGVAPMGDGTEETEAEGLEAQEKEGYEKVIEQVKKTVIKAIEVNIDGYEIKESDIKKGLYIKLNADFTRGSYKGTIYQLTEIYGEGARINFNRMNKKLNKVLTGSASQGNFFNTSFKNLKTWIEKKSISIVELKEVEEIQEVEKWVKIDKSKTTNNSKQATADKKEEKAEVKQEEININSICNTCKSFKNDCNGMSNSYTGCIYYKEQKANSSTEQTEEPATKKQLWALHVATKLDTRNLVISKNKASELISRSMKGESIVEEVKSILEGNSEPVTDQETQHENPYNQEIKDNHIYSVHFKEWNMSMTEIHSELKKMNLEYEDMGEKVEINHINSETARAVKELSNRNGSILFIDFEMDATEFEQVQEKADYILDVSTDIITGQNLEQTEYWNNEEYKNKLFQCVKNASYTITDIENVIKYYRHEYYHLAEVLRGFCEDIQKLEKQQAEKEKLLEKINKSIESLQSKIDALSGDHKVNTWKRMKEQESRDRKKESLEVDIKLIEHVQSKLIDNILLTELEKGLLVGAFRNEIHQWYIRKYGRYPQEIKFPTINYEYDLKNWYNQEVPKIQNRLKKYGINNTIELNQAIDEYKTIYDSVDRFVNPKEQQIKKMTNEAKMQQKGDIHFTTNKNLLNRLLELADIQENEKVLEPSAGIGCIADEIKKYTKNIDVCEYMFSYAELLELKGYKVTANDFLTYNKINFYDKVVANVPFSDEQRHIKHIYNVLKDGGKAVIITSNHWTFAGDKASQEFRNWLSNLTYEVYDVPEKSFEFTNVSAKILVIDKNEETLQNVV